MSYNTGRWLWVLGGILLVFGLTPVASASIHSAPVVIPGHQIKTITHYPINMYRLFRSSAEGKAEAIPFQIDEINEWGDYVLDQGGEVTAKTGNGIFDLQDELAIMGDDVGPQVKPSVFAGKKPDLIYEITLSLPKKDKPTEVGAVYVGVYFTAPPPLSDKRYVIFNQKEAEVVTTRYRYGFDQKNWLVARRVEMMAKGADSKANGLEGAPTPAAPPSYLPLLDSSTFYMKADLKYFLTLEVNHRAINSSLEAFKVGPVRTIVRVSFYYTFLRLNFELGMYTEISFFSNAVYLPAILYNPLDGEKSLNRGSGFYYGMALKENPIDFQIETNMPPYRESGFFDFLTKEELSKSRYWITARGLDRMLYMEITPSKEMREAGAIPMFYRENSSGSDVSSRSSTAARPLGKSPVNLALFFDMTKFKEGEHIMAFRLFFENVNDEVKLDSFKSLSDWRIEAGRVRL